MFGLRVVGVGVAGLSHSVITGTSAIGATVWIIDHKPSILVPSSFRNDAFREQDLPGSRGFFDIDDKLLDARLALRFVHFLRGKKVMVPACGSIWVKKAREKLRPSRPLAPESEQVSQMATSIGPIT